MSEAPKTGFGIKGKGIVSIGKKASTIKIKPATMQIHLLSTFVAPASPILLDEVSTAIATEQTRESGGNAVSHQCRCGWAQNLL